MASAHQLGKHLQAHLQLGFQQRPKPSPARTAKCALARCPGTLHTSLPAHVGLRPAFAGSSMQLHGPACSCMDQHAAAWTSKWALAGFSGLGLLSLPAFAVL